MIGTTFLDSAQGSLWETLILPIAITVFARKQPSRQGPANGAPHLVRANTIRNRLLEDRPDELDLTPVFPVKQCHLATKLLRRSRQNTHAKPRP